MNSTVMKTLKNHLILFDEECPMCRMYTSAFVSTGLLDKAGRAAYQEMSAQACPMVDRQRAADEIALVNQETGEVTYGIDDHFLRRRFVVAASYASDRMVCTGSAFLYGLVYGCCRSDVPGTHPQKRPFKNWLDTQYDLGIVPHCSSFNCTFKYII